MLIRAPIDGTILSIAQRGPGPIAQGTPILEVGDPRSLELVVGVLTRDAVRAIAHPVARIDGWGGAPFLARIVRVDPSAYTRLSALGVEEQRVDVVLDPGAEQPVPPGLSDGFRIEVTLTTFAAGETVTAPASALFREGDGWAAYVVEDGRARLRRVTLGERGDRQVEVRSGLRPGDHVVEHPHDRVRDGVAVRPLDEGER